MALSSNLADLLRLIDANPMWVLMGAAFGGLPLIILLALLAFLLRKLGLGARLENFQTLLFSVFLISWILGFGSQFLLLWMGISGLKMLLVWLVMLVMVTLFCVLNRSYIQQWVRQAGKK